MGKDQLILRAKELGIEGAESLKLEQLPQAIAAAEAAIQLAADKAVLVAKATELGIEGAADVAVEELEKLIISAEAGLAQQRLEAVTTALGIENATSLTTEELTAAVASKLEVKGAEVVKAEEPTGKTNKTFKAQNGKTYGFAPDAPHAFRYAGKLQTQEEWIADKDSMQLMVNGNLNFVQQIKK